MTINKTNEQFGVLFIFPVNERKRFNNVFYMLVFWSCRLKSQNKMICFFVMGKIKVRSKTWENFINSKKTKH